MLVNVVNFLGANCCYVSQGRRPEWILAGAAFLRILVCCLFLVSGHVRPFIGYNASTGYLPIAERLLETGTFNDAASRPDSKYPPIYPFFLAALRWSGVSAQALPLVTVVFQNLFDVLTAVLLFVFSRKPWGVRVALGAALLYLFFPPAAVLATWVTAETLFTCAFVAAFGFLLETGRRGALADAAAAGLLMGFATLVRSTPILLSPLLFYILLRHVGTRVAVLFLASFAAVVLPWTVRNYLSLNDRIPVAVGFGAVFLQGSDERFFQGEGKARFYPQVFEKAAGRGITKPVDGRESSIDRWLTSVAIDQYVQRFEQRPWSFFPFFGHKLLRLWYGTEAGSSLRHALLFVFSAVFAIPGLLFLLWKSRRESLDISHRLVVVAAGYFVALHVLTLPEVRYMIPVFPLLFLGTLELGARLLANRAEATAQGG